MRKSRIERRTPLRSSGRIAPKKKRTAEEEREKFAYEFGSDDRVKWVRWLGCLACYRVPCENHHTENGGKSKKGPARSIVPLCTAHHTECHQHGVKTFEAKYSQQLGGLTLRDHAARLDAFWQRSQSGLTPLAAIVPGVMADLLEDNTEIA